MQLEATALWHMTASHSSLDQEMLLPAEAGTVLVESLYSLISTGTERLVAMADVPASSYEKMGVPFMGGSLALPVKYGYSLVGRIAEEGHPRVGETVHLLHPHQDRIRVPESVLFQVPAKVPARRATLASNVETAVNAVWDSGVSIGDKVLVVGFGIIGSLLARVLSGIAGLDIFIAEKDPARQKLIREMGWQIHEAEIDFDCAFHCSGNESGLQLCIDAVGFEGKIVELSWYGEKAISLKLGSSFHHDRKQIISSQVSQLPTDRRGRWDYLRRKKIVFKLLNDPAFDHHLTHEILFQDLPETFDQIRNRQQDALSWVVRY
ncbi:MAG: zinc-binding alcohol dehydrogenase [Bacteroidota bacterium]